MTKLQPTRSVLFSLAIMTVSATLPSTSYAWSIKTCSTNLGSTKDINLPSNNWDIYRATGSFPSSSSNAYTVGLENSVNEFNRHPSNFFYNTPMKTASSVRLGNGKSEVWGSTDQSVLKGAPAIAWTYRDCYWSFGTVAKITESDVIFDFKQNPASAWQWTPTTSKSALIRYLGNKRLLQGTAEHEIGHAVGLLHENRVYNIMGSDFTHIRTNGSSADTYVGSDASGGLIRLYGLWNNASQDLGVAHWRWTGASGEYSTHSRTRLLNSSGSVLPRYADVGEEPVYRVTKGTRVKAEFTYENLGKSNSGQVPVNFYVSADENITVDDTLISTGYWVSVTAQRQVLADLEVPIPNNLVSGRSYWLGVIWNPNRNPAENRYTNNTSYIRFKVQ